MALFLRIAASLALLRALALAFAQPVVLGTLAAHPVMGAIANGLALGNLGFAFLFWRTATNPAGERAGLYTALLVTGLRGVTGTYEILWVLESYAAVVSLIDMVASVALFVGMLNALPATLGIADPVEPRDSEPPGGARS